MNKLLVIGVAAVFVLLAVGALLKMLLQSLRARHGAYYLRKSVLTPAELAFLEVLEPALPRGVRVLGKVRLEDIFGVKKGLGSGACQSARNLINRRHVDFLLVDEAGFAPLAGIELDDRSHDAEDRRQRDLMVDDIFKGAGLPLLRFPVRKSYDPADLKARIASALSSAP